MKTLLIGLAFAHSSALAQPPAHPALYSFADVYRLTVAGPVGGVTPLESAPETPIRVAAPQVPSEPRFSITAPTHPDRAILLLAGLALAGWVAHRRLAHAL